MSCIHRHLYITLSKGLQVLNFPIKYVKWEAEGKVSNAWPPGSEVKIILCPSERVFRQQTNPACNLELVKCLCQLCFELFFLMSKIMGTRFTFLYKLNIFTDFPHTFLPCKRNYFRLHFFEFWKSDGSNSPNAPTPAPAVFFFFFFFLSFFACLLVLWIWWLFFFYFGVAYQPVS